MSESSPSRREEILDAACDIVDAQAAQGPRLWSIDPVNVAASIGATAQEVAALWPDADDFHVDLGLAMSRRTHPKSGVYSEHSMSIVQELLARHIDLLDSFDGRHWLFIEASRRGAEANMRTVSESTQWRNHLAMCTATASALGKDSTERLSEVLAEGEEEFIHYLGGFYTLMSSILGLRPRIPGLLEPFAAGAIMSRAIMEGFALDAAVWNTAGGYAFVGDPFHVGDSQEWTMTSLAYTSMATTLLEVEPDFDAEAAKRRLAPFLVGGDGA